tara:strand:+ start:148 stop:492 length:345 start_codon:yes stop_codon:yes gene_type:complete
MKVFYDDKCQICNKEINFYKGYNVKNIQWIGIHNNSKKLSFTKVKKEKYLKVLHVIDDDNELKVGVEAFIAIWRKHSYFKYLSIIANIKPIKVFLKIIYMYFAKLRYNRLYKSN